LAWKRWTVARRDARLVSLVGECGRYDGIADRHGIPHATAGLAEALSLPGEP
jgi:hypothetical protein